MKAVIVGAGPVGLLVARALRRRGFDVRVYERGPDPRRLPAHRGRSFNLTLTLRGLSTLEAPLQARLYAQGVMLRERVIHHADGSLSTQPYGPAPQHHLLSLPRRLLHHTLLDEAEAAGAHVRFSAECLRVDPRRGRATFATGHSLLDDDGDLLLGCDGARSVVRHELSRHGARMDLQQQHIAQGYVELHLPPGPDGRHCLLGPARKGAKGAEHGLHLWPRGDFLLLAQPNRDATYTATLFMPLSPAGPGRPSLEALVTRARVEALFAQHFPDVLRHAPQLAHDFLAARPSALRAVRCAPFHLGRTVLLGDAAHTLVPFYGQGINCSFESVEVFLGLLERALAEDAPERAIPEAAARFSAVRRGPSDAISELSLSNLRELSARVGERLHLARGALERELHRRHPEAFAPLYQQVAFSRVPYDEVLRQYARQRAPLDALCERYDVEREAQDILRAFGAQLQAGEARGAA